MKMGRAKNAALLIVACSQRQPSCPFPKTHRGQVREHYRLRHTGTAICVIHKRLPSSPLSA